MERQIAIIGAGFSGIGMAIRLKQAGFDAFTIYERSDRVGGTWRDNHYPGAGCDVPSLLYSFSFEPRATWSRVYAPQREILEYLEACVTKHGLGKHIRFGTSIVHGRFDARQSRWSLRTAAGNELAADVVIGAVGQLSTPRQPNLAGLDSFRGTTFHSAAWRHDHDLAGRSVAIVGTGASAVQLTPHVVEHAGAVTVFQRSASWIIPPTPRNRPYRRWERWALQCLPLYARLSRLLIFLFYEARVFSFFKGSWMGAVIRWMALRSLRAVVADESLRQALIPDYALGCKRILVSSHYYEALTRGHVSVVRRAIDHVEADAIVTDDGARHPVDTIIFATGFESTKFLAPIELEGTDRRRLSVEWKDGAEAYLGVAVAGFPNLFLLFGPNTALGHNSVIFMIERQISYIIACLREMDRDCVRALAVRRDAQGRFNAALRTALGVTQWAGTCTSWYKTAAGKITNNWPGSVFGYWRRTLRLDRSAFYALPARVTERASAAVTESAHRQEIEP